MPARRLRKLRSVWSNFTAAKAAQTSGSGMGVLPEKSRLRAITLARNARVLKTAPPKTPKALLNVIV